MVPGTELASREAAFRLLAAVVLPFGRDNLSAATISPRREWNGMYLISRELKYYEVWSKLGVKLRAD